MAWRENYFGSFTQYSTTREYLDKRDRGVVVGDPLELKYRPGKVSASTDCMRISMLTSM